MTTVYKEDLSEKTILLSDDKVFYTVEGEGEYFGYPSVFMRLSMCNLTISPVSASPKKASLAVLSSRRLM